MSTPPPRRRRIAGERRRSQDTDEQAAVVSEPPAELDGSMETSETALPQAPVEQAPASAAPAENPPEPGRGSWLAFGTALVAAVALVTTALVLGLVTWDYREVREHDRVQEAQDGALAAAERAAVAVLTFKHDSLDSDLQSASRFLSDTRRGGEPSFRQTYTEAFEENVVPMATQTKATVTAEVLASAVVNASERRAEILVFVDQTTVSTTNGGRPRVALNRTTFEMVEENGSWLVADITSY